MNIMNLIDDSQVKYAIKTISSVVDRWGATHEFYGYLGKLYLFSLEYQKSIEMFTKASQEDEFYKFWIIVTKFIQTSHMFYFISSQKRPSQKILKLLSEISILVNDYESKISDINPNIWWINMMIHIYEYLLIKWKSSFEKAK